MSVLIKGMEMPRSCAECYVAWERCHRTVEWYKNNPQYYDIRHEDCPLVPVPPHGRLIDVDALEVHKFAGAEHDISIADGGACYRRGWNDAIEAIMENAETIIGEE